MRTDDETHLAPDGSPVESLLLEISNSRLIITTLHLIRQLHSALFYSCPFHSLYQCKVWDPNG